MNTSLDELKRLLSSPEGEKLEFKSARLEFKREKLFDYCAALANEGGGKLILGVDDEGKVVGSAAFTQNHNKLCNSLYEELRIHINVEEVMHPNGRVLIFHVPSRPPARRVKSTGKFVYPIRRGESLVEMDDETTKAILTEIQPDFTSEIVSGLTFEELDAEALAKFRLLWAKKSGRDDFENKTFKEVLEALGLFSDAGVSYAALILLAKSNVIQKYLPDAEIIFEWRQLPEKTAYDFRKSWCAPFLLIFDEIWEVFNEKNLRFSFQEGFIQSDIWAFSEKVVREAVLNAVTHRDYTLKGHSIFITASPASFSIESPGGFPIGVDSSNILNKHVWRNRLLADALSRIGLVERSGQGLNDIFEDTIRSGKGMPVIKEVDHISVLLNVPAQVQDQAFIAYLAKKVRDRQILLSTEEIVELERLRVAGESVDIAFKEKFLNEGLVERVGQTSGAKYILAHEYYSESSKRGQYTKLVGISRDQRKLLVLNHIKRNRRGRTKEFREAMPEVSSKDIENLLQELKREGKIEYKKAERAWFLKED